MAIITNAEWEIFTETNVIRRDGKDILATMHNSACSNCGVISYYKSCSICKSKFISGDKVVCYESDDDKFHAHKDCYNSIIGGQND